MKHDVNKKTIMWVTDDPWQKTGYGMTTRNVLRRLAKDYNVYALGCQHRGGTIDEYEGYCVLPILQEEHAYDVIEEYIRRINPDFLVTLWDVGLQVGYIYRVNSARRNFNWRGKWYAYIPIDSATVAWGWKETFMEMDMVVAMSDWGAKMIEEQTGGVIKPVTIPLGVDTKVFRPLPENEKRKMLEYSPFRECFIVGAVGRNQYRKMWNYLIRGFAKFAKDKNDVCLLYHSEKRGGHVADGWDYQFIGNHYGCYKKMVQTIKDLDLFKRFWIDDVKMNEIFNSFDVFCWPTGGEGFGMPLIEAQAAGIPVITTAFTTGFELVEGHGELIPVLKDHKGRDVMWQGQNGVEFAIPDEDAIAELLEKLYNDRKLLKKYAQQSREHSLKYDWDKIVEMWVELFKKDESRLVQSGAGERFYIQLDRDR